MLHLKAIFSNQTISETEVVVRTAGVEVFGRSGRLPTPAGSGDHLANEAPQIVDNSVVRRSVIVLKSRMPFQASEHAGRTKGKWRLFQLL